MPTEKLPKLTTTSFALLGLLQRQSWSAYELTRYMRNSILRAVWPRAESHLYSEPKLLLKRGYVDSRSEHHGARKRTVYSITEAGRQALKDWLRQERDSEFRFEYELLVRLAFAESVEGEWLMRYLRQVRDEALRDAEEARAGVEAILADGNWEEHVGAPYTGTILHLIADQLEARLAWTRAMEKRLAPLAAGDQSGKDSVPPAQLAENLYREASERLAGILQDRDSQ